jgi:hypothetical protein
VAAELNADPKIHAGNPGVAHSDELCEGHDRGVTMTTPTPPEGDQPPQSPQWSNRLLLGLGSVILFVAGVAVGSSGSESNSRPAAQGQLAPAPHSAAVPTYSPPPIALPTPEDFTIDVKILEKQCFGSAGCNVVYQIDPTYTGATPLTGRTLTVVYEVTGSEYGPQINNFQVNADGSASVDSTEHRSGVIGIGVEGPGDEYLGELNTSVARGPVECLVIRHPRLKDGHQCLTER